MDQFQNTLCEAIKKRITVRLRYKNDTYYREFDPYFVYISTTGKTLTSGWQKENPMKPSDNDTFHKFNLELITDITFTNKTFNVQPRFMGVGVPEDCQQLLCGLYRS